MTHRVSVCNLAFWFATLAAGVVLLATPAPSQQTAEPDRETSPRTYLGRVIAPPMSYDGAAWLLRPTRLQEEQPQKMLAALGLKPGGRVCDFGCGNGFHSVELARRVGAQGLVDAVDLDPRMLRELRRRAADRGLTQIKTVLATEGDANLPRNAYDLVLMVDVYHELSDPAATLTAVARSLKVEGRLALVEFRAEDPEVPIRPLHKMTLDQIVRELTASGLKLVEQIDELPWQHLVFFVRGDSPLPSVAVRPWALAEVP